MEGTITRLESTIEHQRSQIDSYVERIGRSVIETTGLRLQVEQLKGGQATSDGGSLSFDSFPKSHAVDSLIASAASSCGGGLPQHQTVAQAYDLLLTASKLSNQLRDVHRKWRSSISPRSTKDQLPDPPSITQDCHERDQDNLQEQFEELQNAYELLSSQIVAVADQLKAMNSEVAV